MADEYDKYRAENEATTVQYRDCDAFARIVKSYNDAGADAVEPLDVHWLISEVRRLRMLEQWQTAQIEWMSRGNEQGATE